MDRNYESRYAAAKQFKNQKAYEAFFREKSIKYSLIIWGMGALGKTICNWLLKNKITVEAFCDNNRAKIGTYFEGIRCVQYEHLEANKDKVYIIVAVADKREKYNRMINEQLKSFPNVYHNPLGISAYLLQTFDLEAEQWHRFYNESYKLLCDSKSKEIYKFLFDLRMQSSIIDYGLDYMDKYFDDNQYIARDVVDYKNVRTVVDCGAFCGDSLQEFIDANIGTEYHCFEMDAEVFEILSRNVKEKYSDIYKNIYLYLLGVGEKNEDINYISDMNGASRVSGDGERYARIVSLDSVFEDREVDYIKMDIEGAEESAITGACGVIRRDHPILAISMYHNFAQFVQIPLLIHQICPEYKIFIRHHKYTFDDTVCYAVFDERR